MKVILKYHTLVLVAEEAQEVETLANWEEENRGHVFAGKASSESGYVMTSLGPREEACHEPVSINSTVDDPQWRLISNFAHAPFTLDGRDYANVEGFWQGLKFAPERERRRLAQMPGPAARHEGQEKGYGAQIMYEGQAIIPGTWDHWVLMEKACRAKFTQDADARAALLSTGRRPLEHRMRRDSHSIPGAIMAEIWMRIRAELAATNPA
jgi:predicted NAD-dependent protein-ADP-ribosyltransferase YbiA (DUF1768 family)